MICGLVLAAGAGTRFGDQPKQLAELEGRPLLEWAVRASCNAHVLTRVVVVLGAEQIAALTRIDGDVGARDLLRGARVIEVGHICSGRDVDTPEDLEEVRHAARAVL